MRLTVALGMLASLPVGASESVRFDYRAPPECPDLTTLVGRVHLRSVRHRDAVDGEPARLFSVAISTHDHGATGRVDFVDATGNSVSRTIDGKTCDEVVSGIALVSALAIDDVSAPEAQGSAESNAAESAAAPVASSTEQAAVPTRPPPPKAAREGSERTSKVPISEQPVTSRPSEATVRFEAGLGAGFSSYVGPSGAAILDGFIGVRPSELGGVARVSAWHFRSDATRAGREARFRGYGLRIDACPLTLGTGRVFAEPCVGVDGGLLHAAGVAGPAVTDPRSTTRFWWAAALIGRFGVVASDWVVLEGQAELGVPLVAHRFGFGEPPGEARVFDVPRVGACARGGVTVRFW